MPRTTVRFTGEDEDLYDHLEDIRDERDRSLNYLIVNAVRQVYDDANHTESHHTDAERIESERLNTIESRLEEIEARLEDLEDNDDVQEHYVNGGTIQASGGEETPELPPLESVPDEIREFIAAHEYRHGAKKDDRDDYYARQWALLQQRGSVTRGELKEIHEQSSINLSWTTWSDKYIGELPRLPGVKKAGRNDWQFDQDDVDEVLVD